MADTGGTHEIQSVLNAEGTTDFTGMDRQAKACIAGNIKSEGIIRNPAHALFARHVETRHQRIVAAGGIFGGGNHALGAKMAFTCHDDTSLDARLFLGREYAIGDAGKIGVGPEADPVAMIGRNDDLAIDRVDRGKLGQVAFGQQRIITLGAEERCHLVIGLDELGKVAPDITSIADETAGIDAILFSLSQRKFGRCGALDMAMNFGFQQMCGHRKLRPCVRARCRDARPPFPRYQHSCREDRSGG